jgi:HEAT repeat protein
VCEQTGKVFNMNKRAFLLFATVLVLASFPIHPTKAAESEQQLIAVLQSNASLTEKDDACAKLKFIGTSRCIPALAALLTDEQLSHSARYALEPMKAPEASKALLDALSKTKGLVKVGIINSLGSRAELQAAPELVKLLKDSDEVVAMAAACALGHIGGSTAIDALRTASKTSSGPLHAANVDGLLRCANLSLAAKDFKTARALFQEIYDTAIDETIQVAAYRGLLRSSGAEALELMTKGIQGPHAASQLAALQFVTEINIPHATEKIAALLPSVEPSVQVALIDGLGQRGDPAALPDLVGLASHSAPEVQLGIINALALLGDASVVPLLGKFAAETSGAEQKAARQALIDINRGKVSEVLVSEMESTGPAVQSELARALGARGDKAAVPKLLELAQRASDSSSKAALEALALLVDNSQLSSLIQLVVQATKPSLRDQAAQAVNSACQRLQSQGNAQLTPFVDALQKSPPETRIALLPTCSGLVDPGVRDAVRSAAKDSNTEVRTAAVRALCDSTDPELLQDIVQVAGSATDANTRSLAISGAVRLAGQEEGNKLSNAQRFSALETLLAAAERPEQKRMVLAGLGEIPEPKGLKLIEPLFDDAAVKTEAARAAARIASMLPGREARDSEPVLKKALLVTTDESTHKAVEAALEQVRARVEYLTDWQVSGPYRQAGKDYEALFDIAFPPEGHQSNGAVWKALPASTDPKRPWAMDLLKSLGGEQCVAYARTWVRCEQEQPAVLELGSDDGVKVWVNEKQIYAQNVARALQPGSDKVKVSLNRGWNTIVFKITQNNQGWEFCARLLKPDGSPLEGLRCEGTPQITAK